ncbi:hypothetical protein RE628_17580 [Paenibacillus sp. D2_2]|nr:hypothetical protein [Paenibacillus sp. D2_2]WMT39263.1 hypothetical protein RE628_17580 [Paenibacillus sp. D2_2]
MRYRLTYALTKDEIVTTEFVSDKDIVGQRRKHLILSSKSTMQKFF